MGRGTYHACALLFDQRFLGWPASVFLDNIYGTSWEACLVRVVLFAAVGARALHRVARPAVLACHFHHRVTFDMPPLPLSLTYMVWVSEWASRGARGDLFRGMVMWVGQLHCSPHRVSRLYNTNTVSGAGSRTGLGDDGQS